MEESSHIGHTRGSVRQIGSTLLAFIGLSSLAVLCHGQSVSLDTVHGLHAEGYVFAETKLVFDLRYTVDDTTYVATVNGFRVYSPDGAQWDSVRAGWTDTVDLIWFENQLVTRHSCTGSDADTIGFAGFCYEASIGLPDTFDAVACSITVGPIGAGNIGKTICLDSSFYRPNNRWIWIAEGYYPGQVSPSWDGPHCFRIVECCHVRGDIDHNGAGPDIADYVYLTTFIFQDGPSPPCMDEADVDASGGPPNIADLFFLREYLFGRTQSPAPRSCTQAMRDP